MTKDIAGVLAMLAGLALLAYTDIIAWMWRWFVGLGVFGIISILILAHWWEVHRGNRQQ